MIHMLHDMYHFVGVGVFIILSINSRLKTENLRNDNMKGRNSTHPVDRVVAAPRVSELPECSTVIVVMQ